jgi:F-type H+/Na+-transporting ATPase subunit alpha
MSVQLNEAAAIKTYIEKSMEGVDLSAELSNEGVITSIQDGIARVSGISQVMAGEMIAMPGDTYGLALNLERDSVGVIVLGAFEHLNSGDLVRCTGRILEVPVGTELLGRVVDGLGRPIDGKGSIKAKQKAPIEKVAPGVIARQSVDQPLQTGIKAIDTMTPIGKGQRELIIGDRQTGKTAIAIDTILNQKGKNVQCIYVAIGQKASSVVALVDHLEAHGAMEYTTVVAANAADSPSLQYIAPYTGCTLGEYYRDLGQDALVIYDDLSKHAVAYRQISLLLRRPPGREAFPGDVFYLHSRLLERAACVNADYVAQETKGKVKDQIGSLTALPIIETQAGDVSAFIPTNVISITDGQIYLDVSLFNSGIRPAINSGLSVSRVGGSAQTKIIKKLGSMVRVSLAQYRELEAFSQFASDLDEATRNQLERGQRTVELMKQAQYAPCSVGLLAISLFMIQQGHLDEIPVDKIVHFERALHAYIQDEQAALLDLIHQKPVLTDTLKKDLGKMIDTFKKTQAW